MTTCRKLTVERVYTPGFTLTADQYDGIKPYTTTLHISYPAAPNQAVSVVLASITGDACVKDATLNASGKADVSYEVRRTHMIYVMLKKTDCCTSFDYMNCPTSNYALLKVGALGSISFASVPEGAEIFLDGADQLIRTPVTITDVPAGSHTYTLKLNGYNDYTGTVEVLKDQTVSVSSELVPAEGCILFSTVPAGAKVIVDGNDTGKVTPVLICGLSTGPHTYRLSLAGYLDSTGSVELAAGLGTKVTVTIERKFGSISFASTPSGAQVFLDGVDQGMVTPATLTNVPIGSHAFTLKLAGYNDYTGTVEVLENQISTVSATLTPIEGCVFFNTTPAGAKIFIDDVDTGQVTPALICGLSLGTHTYRLVLADYTPATGSVTLVAGKGAVVSVSITHETGSISFKSIPDGAEIIIDGVDQLVATPATITEITGTHDYTLRKAGYNDYSGVITVSVGQTVTVEATLVPAEGCIYFNTTPAGAKIFIDDVDTGQVTPALVCGLSLGTHTYRLVLAGYYEAGGAIPLTPGQGATIIASPFTEIPKKGIGAGTLLGLGLLGAGVLGAVIITKREKKYSPPK